MGPISETVSSNQNDGSHRANNHLYFYCRISSNKRRPSQLPYSFAQNNCCSMFQFKMTFIDLHCRFLSKESSFLCFRYSRVKHTVSIPLFSYMGFRFPFKYNNTTQNSKAFAVCVLYFNTQSLHIA